MGATNLNKVIEQLRSVCDKHAADGITDAELWKRYVNDGDEAAFELLVRRHGPMVFAVCRRVLHNVHDAEDAFQATFLVLVRRASGLRSPAQLGNWLYGVAYRTALHARAAARRRQAKEAAVIAPTTTTEDSWGELRTVLDQELQRLPENIDLSSRSATWKAGPARKWLGNWVCRREPWPVAWRGHETCSPNA